MKKATILPNRKSRPTGHLLICLSAHLLICLHLACNNSRVNPLEDETEPQPPTELSATILPNGIQLTWEKSTHANTYKVFRNPPAENDVGKPYRVGIEVPQFTDTNVVNGTSYEYWVLGVGPGDEDGSGINGNPSQRISVTFSKQLLLRGRFINVFTRASIPEVQIAFDPDVGTVNTANNGAFSVAYEQEGVYHWTASHLDFLPNQGEVRTRETAGELGDIPLIPIPKEVAGEVDARFGEFDKPWSIVLSDDERQGFIVNQNGNFVSIFDTSDNRVRQTVDVGEIPTGAVYFEGKLFVANSRSDTVSVIEQGKIKETLNVSGFPAYLAAHSDRLYVTLQAGRVEKVAIVNINNGQQEAPILVGVSPSGIAVAPDGGFLYVANRGRLSVVELGTKTESAQIPIGQVPQGVAISPGGMYVYIADSARITRVNTVTRAEEDSLEQPNTLFGWLAVVELPDGLGDLVYATDEHLSGNRIWMWHPQSGASDSIPVGRRPFGIAATKDGRRVYFCEVDENRVRWLEN